jgi:hypothetical protein
MFLLRSRRRLTSSKENANVKGTKPSETGTPPMIDAARLLTAHPDKLVREALGLAALCVAILAALFLPTLA